MVRTPQGLKVGTLPARVADAEGTFGTALGVIPARGVGIGSRDGQHVFPAAKAILLRNDEPLQQRGRGWCLHGQDSRGRGWLTMEMIGPVRCSINTHLKDFLK